MSIRRYRFCYLYKEATAICHHLQDETDFLVITGSFAHMVSECDEQNSTNGTHQNDPAQTKAVVQFQQRPTNEVDHEMYLDHNE